MQHLAHEHGGVLAEVLAERGDDVVDVRCWEGEAVPADPAGFDAVVVLGGDMDTDQDAAFPHLRDERALLAASVDAGVPALGLCLGAQLLAEATGGRVHHRVPEIGYPAIRRLAGAEHDPVLRALPDGAELFNAHRDAIEAPPSATVLACSDQTSVHAFRVGGAVPSYGLQFHAEIDASYVATYVEVPGVPAYLRGNGWEPQDLLREARRRNEQHRAIGRDLFTTWASWAERARHS